MLEKGGQREAKAKRRRKKADGNFLLFLRRHQFKLGPERNIEAAARAVINTATVKPITSRLDLRNEARAELHRSSLHVQTVASPSTRHLSVACIQQALNNTTERKKETYIYWFPPTCSQHLLYRVSMTFWIFP